MTTAQALRANAISSAADATPTAVGLVSNGVADLRLAVHDASRVEWTVSLPLAGQRSVYAVEVRMDVPSSAFVPHEPWGQLQSVTRLDGAAGASSAYAAADASVDALRRSAVDAAQKLSRAHDGFARHARLAGSLANPIAVSDLEGLLVVWLDAATGVVADVRTRLVTLHAEDGEIHARERRLIDEYISTRFIEMLAGSERSLTTLEGSRSPHVVAYAASIEAAEDRVAEALERELHHRVAEGYILADPDVSESLEAYVDRASQLKKHFQEVLFLDKETFEVAKRIHHWVAALAALLASTWAFAWQIALASRAHEASSVGPRILALAAMAGIVYAAKDRIKEVGRAWISGHVHRLYAQKVVRYRAPARRAAGRDLVATARETFDQTLLDVPDPLHPLSGAVLRTVVLRFKHVGQMQVCPALSGGGARGVKHVFRYDFSPFFARLGDAVRKVPVLDAKTNRLTFREAPRCYRIPIRVKLTAAGNVKEEVGTLVLSKRGLERLECGAATTESAAADWLF